MKAYSPTTSSTTPLLFRPDKNMSRLQSSMSRLALPTFDSTELISLLKSYVQTESSWIPTKPGYSLYLRPTAIGTHPYLGVDVSDHVTLYVIASPVGPYYPQGFKPVSLLCDSANARAWPGGVGKFKVGGNYGPTIKPGEGYDFVVVVVVFEERATSDDSHG